MEPEDLVAALPQQVGYLSRRYGPKENKTSPSMSQKWQGKGSRHIRSRRGNAVLAHQHPDAAPFQQLHARPHAPVFRSERRMLLQIASARPKTYSGMKMGGPRSEDPVLALKLPHVGRDQFDVALGQTLDGWHIPKVPMVRTDPVSSSKHKRHVRMMVRLVCYVH